ncbi:MAG: homogentisate 1,2-dioxygenase, partial [Bacteroidia bacterium]
MGQIPPKRHTQFRKPDGSLYAEELISTEGFSSLYSLVYHAHPPTLVKEIEKPIDVSPVAALPKNMQNRSFLTFKAEPKDDFLDS